MPTLTLIRGLPGSGKSTYAKEILNKSPQARWKEIRFFESDDFFTKSDGSYKFDNKLIGHAHQWCFQSTLKALNQNYDVVVANTFTTSWEMRRYVFEVKDYIANLTINIIELKTSFGSIHNVPQETLDKMAQRWEDIPAHWIETNQVNHVTYIGVK